jgi:glycyl-tRNA synthetase beta chain
MAELFIELFSEEIPSNLQIDARNKIKNSIDEKLKKKEIKFSLIKSFSTPQRLVFIVEGLPEKIIEKKKLIKGPKVGSPQQALEGFIKSNNLASKDIFKKKIEKGEFFFVETKPKTINVLDELQTLIPNTLKEHPWKKSMKWADYEATWGRPLKSITSIFNNKVVNFNFFHIKSDNLITINGDNGEQFKRINNFKTYSSLLKSQNIILDQEKRKNIIMNKINAACKNKNLTTHLNEKLIEEVVNLVEKPNVVTGKFNEIYLKVPQEILIITMQKHQKYFPLFDGKKNLINFFLLVSNLPDKKGYIKIGNQRVIEARLADAKFFWEKNKNQSLVKQVSKLKSLQYFNKLGTFYDRTQRLRKLASLISEYLDLSKEKVEITSSICKSDLVSDLVGEFPELQGVMGKYFAIEQGFELDVSNAIMEHYLPVGLNSELPNKKLGSAVAIIDKIDVLVGFFGIEEKPTSSNDPFALRRTAIGLLRIITENRLNINLKDLINFSIKTYEQQGVKFSNNNIEKDIFFFLKERFKNILKNKNIRKDVIQSVIALHNESNFLNLYKKCIAMNKNISKEVGKSIIGSYKRASNIINQEIKNYKEGISGNPESYLFKKDEEKYLYEKINDIRKYFSNVKKVENYEETLGILAASKLTTDNFFDNVIVNDDNLDIKKNRLELLQMFCKTYENFIDFSKIEGA